MAPPATSNSNSDSKMDNVKDFALNDNIVEYLISRVSELKNENRELKNENQSLKTEMEKDKANKDDVIQRVIDCSTLVAQTLMEPPAARRDLSMHKSGRAVLPKLKQNKLDDFKQLLQNDRSVLLMRVCTSGNTILHEACIYNAVDVVEYLCQLNEIDLLATNLLGKTALHIAAEYLNINCCKVLAKYMNDPTGEAAPLDIVGVTPAGYSALKRPKKPQDVANKRECTQLLHRVGDTCISPLPRTTKKKSRLKFNDETVVLNKYSNNSLSENLEQLTFDNKLLYGYCSMPGFRVTMEDAICINIQAKAISLFAVFDGHGGRTAADYSAHHLIEIFQAHEAVISGSAVTDPDALQTLLIDTVNKLEYQLSKLPNFQMQEIEVRKAMGDESRKVEHKCADPSGTTCILAAVSHALLAVANVGDSRCILIKQDASVVEMSMDHKADFNNPSPAEERFIEMERRRIEAAGGSIADGYVSFGSEKLAMTRSLANFDGKQNQQLDPWHQIISAEPEVRVYTRNSSEDLCLLLACDGIFDVMSNVDAARFISSRLSPSTPVSKTSLNIICEEMLLNCLELNSQDNMSAILISLLNANPDVPNLDPQHDLLPRKINLTDE